ncbi:MAG: PIN domain-containing protein [Lautropia sp.]|nr:PIN domain-containing protein [Lautropia sp.]
MKEPRPEWMPQGPRAVLIDSGPLIALFNAADRWHAPVRNWLQAHLQTRLVTTWPVLTEVCALLSRRIHNDAALDFLLWVERGAVQVDIPPELALPTVRRICQRFASLPLDLADASIAELADRLGIQHLLSIDADFDVYRNSKGVPLINLLR